MADTLLVNMTQDTSPGGDSMVYTADDPGGTPADRKVTIQHLVGYLVTTAGDMLYATGARALARIAAGSYGQILGMNSGATAPAWQNDDGWVATGATWTYASATTFTITGDYTTVLVPGVKLKLTQTSVKYFRVEASSYSNPTTTVTVSGGGLYTLANAAITSPYYSHAHHPQGFIAALADGWHPSSETWTYASPDTFTIASADYTSILTPGTKLKLTQTTAKYFVVAAVAFSTNTTVTVFSPSGYSLANAAITQPYFSHESMPAGWDAVGFEFLYSFNGGETGAFRQYVKKTGMVDNTATEFATITTTNESGSDDGGIFHAVFEGITAHGSASDSAETSTMGIRAQWARAINAAGAAGNNSAVASSTTTAVAASTAATKTITTATITLVETSEYVQSVKATIDCAGSTVTTGEIYGWLTIYYVGFTSPPVITSA